MNSNVCNIYLQAQLKDYNKLVMKDEKLQDKWQKAKPHWVDE